MNMDLLEQELTIDEGKRSKIYLCTSNKRSIGIGRNLDDVGLSEDEIQYLFKNDIARVCAELDRALPWWRNMSDARQRVLANMCFNMGLGNSTRGLLSFRNTLAAMQAGDYEKAAQGMGNSTWAKQVGKRADRLIEMMRKG
jgi:lysozyme